MAASHGAILAAAAATAAADAAVDRSLTRGRSVCVLLQLFSLHLLLQTLKPTFS